MTKWDAVRSAFDLDPSLTNFAAMSLTSHPKTVQWQIDNHRQALDRQPLQHVSAHFQVAEEAAFQAVASYFGADVSQVALTASTTMGLAQVLGGVTVAASQEILTSSAEHFTTVDTLALRTRRDGTRARTFRLYQSASTATVAEIVATVRAAIRPETRVLTLAWVYSSDGLKTPVADIAAIVAEVNRDRSDPATTLLLVIDGVHGFGVENTTLTALGCDLFIAGCHKWIFGPRGTAVICARPGAWQHVVPIVPSFSMSRRGPGRLHTPGGVHAYEHTLSLANAFHFLSAIGKADLQARVRELVARLRAGLDRLGMPIETPASPDLSAGIVCFRHPREAPADTVARLGASRILVTQSGTDPNGASSVRASVAVFNSEADIDRLLSAL